MKRRELKTIWNSNGLWTGSGYAVEMMHILPRLADDGWPVAQIAFWGLDGSPIELAKWPKIKIYPKMADSYGSDAIVRHSTAFGADITFSMHDVWMMPPQNLKQLKYWIPYVPIDKSPAPPNVLDKLQYAYKILTFSKFGQKELEKKGFTSTLIPEGTDVDIFKPMDRDKCREEFKMPKDSFIFGMVAANKENPPRKGFQEALDAFKMFQDKHPEAALFLSIQQPGPGGFPIKEYANHIGARNLMFMNDYEAIYSSDSNRIARLMNACNVLLHPSQTEGFGLTIIEAQACGIPAIVNNTTSMPELVIDGKTGAICEAEKRGRWTNDLSLVYPADVDSLYEKMEQVFKMLKDNEAKVRDDCRKNIVDNYNIDTLVKERWIPLYEELQDALIPLTNKNKSSNMVKAG